MQREGVGVSESMADLSRQQAATSLSAAEGQGGGAELVTCHACGDSLVDQYLKAKLADLNLTRRMVGRPPLREPVPFWSWLITFFRGR